MRRYGDTDYRWGPFVYYVSSYKPIRATLNSSDDEGDPAYLNATAFGHGISIELPAWFLKPAKEEVKGKFGDYTQYWEREYGFSSSDGFFQIFYGRQTHSSDTTKSKGYFIPWIEKRFVEHRLFDKYFSRKVVYVQKASKPGEFSNDMDKFDKARQEHCRRFLVRDFDGEVVTATATIEERVWKQGDGWFKWLSLFCKPFTRKEINITFSSEVGPRKGSWKGGTMGHGIDLEDWKTHYCGMHKYCDKYNLEFIREVF